MIRKSVRLPEYDYSQEGYYFITICSDLKRHRFGNIVNSLSNHSYEGNIIQKCWDHIPKYFPTVNVDAFVIMPNHIHGILQFTASQRVRLFSIIQNLKSVSTRKINAVARTPGKSVWQRNYYERIIRNERELNMIRLYIKLNPVLWEHYTDLDRLDLSIEKISELLKEFQMDV